MTGGEPLPALRVVPAPSVPDHAGAGIPPPPPGIDLRLDGNLGSSPGPELLDALRDPELLRGYPGGDDLERALAARHRVDRTGVVVTAGADEVLDRIARAVLAPGRRAVVPVPTFEMLERYVALAGAELASVPWTDGAWPRAQVLAAIDARTALVAIVSPNNPTGLVATAADVAAVATAAPHALVLLDGAYAEYADADLDEVARAHANVVHVRTLSKAYGLAGLRVGYAVAHPEVARWLRVVGSPFTAGRFARAAAVARLAAGPTAVAAHVALVRSQRTELTALLAELGAAPLPSQANFVFARPPSPELLRDALAGLGIAVRALRFANLPDLPGGVRITVPGVAAWWQRLQAALRAALRPEAVVLDLDGVLADLDGRRPLAAADDLARLAARLPVAVVTSCPRRLCASVLERYGFAPHVRTAVVAEDGPGKPDPFPVRLALERLGVRAAWMLGDNVVDVEAARGAGVVPFAIEPRGIGAEPFAAELRRAGAARLLPSLREFAALLAAATERGKD